MPNNMTPQQIQQFIKAAIEKALEDTAIAIQEEARDLVPYDTGALHDSIIPEKVSDLSYKVTANTSYAAAVHEGRTTKKGNFIAGKPYLVIPLQNQKDKLIQRIKDNLS